MQDVLLPLAALLGGVAVLLLAARVLGALTDEDGGFVLGVIFGLVVLYALVRLVIG